MDLLCSLPVVWPEAKLWWRWCSIMITSFKVPAGYYQPMPLQEIPGHARASLGQSLMGSLLLSPGSWCTQVFVGALQEFVSSVLCKFWWLYGGVSGNLLKEGLCHCQVYCTQRPYPLQQSTADLYFYRRHSNRVLAQSLWGLWVLVCTRFVWGLQVSLVVTGFDSKWDFFPPTILLGLLFCPWMWSIFLWWDPTFFCQWLLHTGYLAGVISDSRIAHANEYFPELLLPVSLSA